LAERLSWSLGKVRRNEWRFVTLTLKHTSAPLQHQLDFLRKSFRRLRARAFWKRRVQYGYAVIEITYNAERSEWHPHLHILTRSDFIPWKQLSTQWSEVTHGSHIVDVRLIRANRDVVDYVTTYIAKPPPIPAQESDALLIEYYQALHSSRLLIAFGSHRPPLPARVDDEFPNDWQWTEPLYYVLRRANAGDEQALEVLSRVGRIDPYATSPYHDYQTKVPDP
jgi:hypothetical protein